MSVDPGSLTLEIHEEIGVARSRALVRGGVPLPQGAVLGLDDLAVSDPDGPSLPSQLRAAECWPDGSLRWVDVAFLIDLDARSSRTVVFGPRSSAAATPGVVASASAVDDGVLIDTGAVRFMVRRYPFDPAVGFPGVLATDWTVTDEAGRGFSSVLDPDVQLEILEVGPVLVEVVARGRHLSDDGRSFMDFECTITAVAGRPEVMLDHRLINRESGPTTRLSSWTGAIATQGSAAATCGAFDAVHSSTTPFTIRSREAGYRRGIFATSEVVGSEDGWQDRSPQAYRDGVEWSELQGRHASNWIGVESEQGPTFSIVQANFSESHPSAMTWSPELVRVDLWPATAGAMDLAQGMAPAKRLVLRSDAIPVANTHRFGATVDLPLVFRPGPWMWSTGALPETLPFRPGAHPNLEAHIRDELFGWYQQAQSTGLLDGGDCVAVSAGPRTSYSANNEHDALLALLLHWLRSGERAYLESARAYADHLVGIDIIHHSTRNRLERGGVRAHGRGHVHYVQAMTTDGPVETSIDTGHMWLEGLLLFGALTGEPRYRAAARMIGDCLIGLIEVGWTKPEPGPRNSGWPLIALSAMYRATGDLVYLDGARRIARSALAAQAPDGRWTMRVGFFQGFCAWQHAILISGLCRLLDVDPEPDAALEPAIRAGAHAMVTLGRNADGSFIFMDHFQYGWSSRTGLIREALAAAHRLTGDQRYLDAGLAGGQAWYRHAATPALSNDVAEWRGHLPFLARAFDAGLLADADA